MEDPDLVGAYGTAWNYKEERVTDAYNGSYSMKVSERKYYWMGAGQIVQMQQNVAYSVSVYIKQLNNNTKMWQRYEFYAAYQWSADSNDKQYVQLAQHSFGSPDDGWFRLGGDFTSPYRTFHSVNVYIQGPDPGIEFLVDDMELTEITENPNWRTEALQRIEQIRKGDVTISVSVADNLDPSLVELDIKLARHDFPFGSVAENSYITNPDYTLYQSRFYQFFNWATNGGYKWHGHDESSWRQPNYDQAIAATDELRKNGMPVRGHNMFWGLEDGSSISKWIETKSPDQLRQIIQERVQDMTNITIGKLEHWDVNNELLHGQLYEEVSGDPTFTQDIYRWVHAADPNTKLFLNDYDVVAMGSVTDDYVNQANQFRAANCGLYGLGVQSHFRTNIAPDASLLKYRLDKLASTGYPLWITEMTLENADENIRADQFETALTAYFSHPAVEGIILWGFWDHGGTSPEAALVSGNAMYINAAGQRYLNLTKSTWSTEKTSTLSSKNENINMRGFYGDYDVIVKYNGQPIESLHFKLSKTTGNQPNTWSIDVSGNGDAITMPPLPTTVDPLYHNHHVSHEHAHTLGHASFTQSGANDLSCTTKYSGLSQVGDDQTASVSCDAADVMTGCSSVTQDHLNYRDGESYHVDNGIVSCTAVNGWQSSAPVQAMARCCRKTGLKCTYVTAGPSGHGRDDQIEAVCPANTVPMGCTSYTYFRNMDGAFPTNTSCVAQNDGIDSVFTFGSCCHAPSLTCAVRRSSFSGLNQGDSSSVTCNQGETLVGCSVYSEDGRTAGTILDDTNTCTAVNGRIKAEGEEGVLAIAVCCS
ncbi:hypothetical protein ACF0H5_008492 [Mactra antiquata]